MKRLILLLLVALPLWAQTIELSALHYGTYRGLTWQQRDAEYLAARQAQMDNHVLYADFGPFLYRYAYAINDSAFSFLDAPHDSVKVLERYVNYRSGNIVECPVELQWATITKHSPAKVSIAKYNGWRGGPWDMKIPAVKAKDTRGLAVATVKLAEVNAAMNDGKDWTEKANKKLTDTEKRRAAWKVATGKAKADDYTKTAKAKR